MSPHVQPLPPTGLSSRVERRPVPVVHVRTDTGACLAPYAQLTPVDLHDPTTWPDWVTYVNIDAGQLPRFDGPVRVVLPYQFGDRVAVVLEFADPAALAALAETLTDLADTAQPPKPPTAGRGCSVASRPTVVLMCGLPASGKSTIARALRDQARGEGRLAVVVSRDTIRDMIGIGWSGGHTNDGEQLVSAIQAAAIRAAVRQGADVVVDDTNLRADVRERLENVARQAGAHCRIRNVPTDVEVCVQRDAQRPEPEPGGPISGCRVGETVIRYLAAGRPPQLHPDMADR